jgi:PAS domain S-box-containing protein
MVHNGMRNATLKVLLLEDNPADADLLQEMLNETGSITWELTHVEKLKVAVQCLQQSKFDVVLSDLSLPDAQGLDTVIQIQAIAPDLPIVVLTGLNDEEIGLAALRRGAQDYLNKGQLQSEVLVRTVSYAIERSQTQRVLRQQAAAMAASMEGIAILNYKQEHTYVNQAFARLYNYPHPEELIGVTWESLYPPEHHKFLQQQISTILQQQGYWRGEAIARRRCGEEFYQELSITTLSDGGFVCNVRDISERKQAEADILKALEREKELSELKSRFVSIVSHEFRTPLTTILSSAELIQKYGLRDNEEKNRVRFGRIVNGVHRMTQLLDDVLMFNRMEAGKLQFNPTLLNLMEFCEDLIEEMQAQITAAHTITFTPKLSTHTYYLDEHLLRHILTNLISNAIKYSPGGGTVQLKLVDESEKVTFHIQDQGIGILPTDMEELFTIFHRGSNVEAIPGTGLGLAIVKQCVELHGGTIHVISNLGEGTEFTVILPTHVIR